MVHQHNVSLQGDLQCPAEQEQVGGPLSPEDLSWEIPAPFGLAGALWVCWAAAGWICGALLTLGAAPHRTQKI